MSKKHGSFAFFEIMTWLVDYKWRWLRNYKGESQPAAICV